VDIEAIAYQICSGWEKKKIQSALGDPKISLKNVEKPEIKIHGHYDTVSGGTLQRFTVIVPKTTFNITNNWLISITKATKGITSITVEEAYLIYYNYGSAEVPGKAIIYKLNKPELFTDTLRLLGIDIYSWLD